MPWPIRWFLWINARPRRIRPGLITSIRASYTRPEVEAMAARAGLEGFAVTTSPVGLKLTGHR